MNILEHPKCFKMFQIVPKQSKMFPNAFKQLETLEMVQNIPKWFRMV
jgi:hypothetical protein